MIDHGLDDFERLTAAQGAANSQPGARSVPAKVIPVPSGLDPATAAPTILTTGTRDLLLSDAVRTHRKLRRAGVAADLHVYEGLSHAQYTFDPSGDLPKEVFGEVARFFDVHLAR